MARIDLTGGYQTITAAGTSAGGDISGVTGDFTLHIKIRELKAASGTPGAVFLIEDTVNDFTAKEAVKDGQAKGTIQTSAPCSIAIRKRDIPWLRAGTASAKARINVSQLKGTSPSLTYWAYIETA